MVALYITGTDTENRLSVPVTAGNLNAPSCSVAQGVTENGAMNDSADVPATRDGTAPPGDFVRRHLEWIQQNERAKHFLDCVSEIRRGGCAVDPSVDRTLKGIQMATEPGCYFGEIALQAVVTTNRL